MSYSEYYIKYCEKNSNAPNAKFIVWVNQVEQIVIKHLNMNLLEIPDEDYMYYYESKMSSNDMAKIILDQYKIYQ